MFKSLLAFLLTGLMLAQGLLPRTALDLLRSPEVMKHYREHQQEEKEPLGFMDFLMMHYSADSEHTKQKKHHLPIFDLQSVVGFFVVPVPFISFESPLVVALLDKAAFQWRNAYTFQPFEALICPPRA
ncbi:MAG: hypothetical protein R2822_22715 [Spirosomataceae bacterium]